MRENQLEQRAASDLLDAARWLGVSHAKGNLCG
jgi:hypothetical protein